jgi:hypothetical protein
LKKVHIPTPTEDNIVIRFLDGTKWQLEGVNETTSSDSEIVPIENGDLALPDKCDTEANPAPAHNRYTDLSKLFVVIVISVGFLIVLIKEVTKDNLSFSEYWIIFAAILVGLGLLKVGKRTIKLSVDT